MRACIFKNIDDDMKEDWNQLCPLFPTEKISQELIGAFLIIHQLKIGL